MLKRSFWTSKLICLILAVITLMPCLTACLPSGENDDTDEAVNTQDAVIFTDALGREVSVPKNPERVAALIGSFADVWQLAGGTLCASADDAWDDFGLGMGDAVNLGKTKEPNVEKLFASDPDLVIASASTSANVEMLETLENAGITVAYFDVSSFNDYLKMLEICTSITGRDDLYEKNGVKVKAQINAIKEEFAAADIPEEKRTVLFLRASSGYIRAKNSKNSILGEMLRDLGCINIADDDDSLLENLSIEIIIKRDPYRIFIVQVGNDEKAVKDNVTKMMNENIAWLELSAVTEERIHYMDKRLFNLKPNALWGNSYEILCTILQN